LRFNCSHETGCKIAGIPPQQAKTGLAGDPGIADIARDRRDRKGKTLTAKDTKEHEGIEKDDLLFQSESS
jgi:hypothetical protein